MKKRKRKRKGKKIKKKRYTAPRHFHVWSFPFHDTEAFSGTKPTKLLPQQQPSDQNFMFES